MEYPKMSGPYIAVKPVYYSRRYVIGIVVSFGKSVDSSRVKTGDHVRFNPNYATSIYYHGNPFLVIFDEPFIEESEEPFVEGQGFIAIEDIEKFLSDSNGGLDGKNIVKFKEE